MASSRDDDRGLNPEFQYPFAAAPDIIRSNQKDAYFQGVLVETLSNALRSVYGARFVHRYSSETRTVADLIYFSCTTLLGNRTLGEEYCDIVQVERDSLKLPTIARRGGYILSSVVLPYALTKALPGFRQRLSSWLERSIGSSKESGGDAPFKRYILRNIGTLTSPAPVYALGLSIFYFSGAYYHISKRIWGLRYIFTKRIEPSDQRVGYEVLGVLLILQLIVQAYLHVQSTLNMAPPTIANMSSVSGGAALLSGGVEVGLGVPQANDVLLEAPIVAASKEMVEAHTATPVLSEPRYQLADPATMQWIEGRQQRKCTLCLEELKDPSATTCGHVFCWTCIADWIKEKPECPLCRQGIMSQHVLPLRE